MTVLSELSKIAYIGSSSQTLYPIPFEYINTDDIKVSVYTSNNEFVEDWTYSVQYVIEGGNVKVLSGYNIDNTKKLLVLRRVDLVQDNKYREGGDFPAKSTETSFDKLTMITQQLQETLDRCVKVEVLDIQSPEELLQTVYDKLDSATEIAGDAISAANQAQTAADNATAAVNSAEQTLVQTQAYVDSAKVEINNTKNTAINTINSTVSTAKGDITNAAAEATATAKANADAYVDGTIKPELQTYVTAAAASQQAAATSETNAGVSETNAAQSALLAQTLAERVRSEGIPMSIIEQRRIEKTADTVKLWWKDPRDTIIDGFVLASWKSTTIVKKQGGYPEDINDGTVVEIITQRNKYFDTPLTDNQANAANWYYRAFPLTVNGVYGLDKRNCFGAVLFGYRINKNEPVPSAKVEYLQYCDNYFYDPCRMDFTVDKFGWGSWRKAFMIPKPCALTYAGAVSYYLDPDDFTKKADGTASDVSNSAFGGNFMVEFPDIFVKFWDEDNYFYCLFSNIKLDDGFECWATKKADGTYTGRFYMPMFEGTNIDSKLRSVATTGKPTASINAETEATLAHANGTNWETTTWAQELLMILLYPLLFKSTDSQGTLGYGGSDSTSGLTVNNNAAVTRGLMYGTSGAAAAGMTYLGMHNYWGHRWRRPNGLMNMNGNYAFKMTPSTVDGSTVTGFNRTGNGYIKSGVVPPEAGASYIDRYQAIGKLGFVPQKTSGSSTTHFCDGMWTNNGRLDHLALGGVVYAGAFCGVFCFNVSIPPSDSVWDFGASVSYTPF